VNSSAERRLAWIFRIAVCMEYVGHGAFGVLTKKAWVPYFGVFGIPEPWAWKLMPILGTFDILLGICVLIRPCRALLLYMSVWGFATALLRPLSGEPVWEAVERAGNFGVPLAFFLFTQARGWLTRAEPRPFDPALCDRVAFVLRATTGTLLVGHGVLAAAMQKAVFSHHLEAAHLPFVPVPALGGFEIALGLAVLLAPVGPLLLFIFAWKVVTELLYPLSGAPFLEVVERGGSYAAPLALYFLSRSRSIAARYLPSFDHPARAAAH
jgi:hypothetical protein